MSIRIIYPEDRFVDPEEIISWYKDAVANNQLDADDTLTVYEMALALEDIGHITMGRRYILEN